MDHALAVAPRAAIEANPTSVADLDAELPPFAIVRINSSILIVAETGVIVAVSGPG